MAEFEPRSDLDEMRGLLSALPDLDDKAAGGWRARAAALIRPRQGFGALEEFGPWLSAVRGTSAPRLERPRIAIFASAHGIGVNVPGGLASSAAEQEIQRINAMVHPSSALAAAMDAELRVYELALEAPCGDASVEAAMSEDDAAKAMAYGMMAVEEGVDLMILADCSAGADASLAAIATALINRPRGPEDWLQGATERELAHAALARLGGGEFDSFSLMAELGGYDMAAMIGTILAARMGRVPVLLDGAGPMLAALLLEVAREGASAHCALPQPPQSALERDLAEALSLDKAVLPGADIALGRGAAGVMALGPLQALIRVQSDTATFGA